MRETLEHPKPETVGPMLAVFTWKHAQMVQAQRAIVERAMRGVLVAPGDVPEGVVDKADRQGVSSNAWNALRAVGVIERVPMTLSVPGQGVFGGRRRNPNPSARGRWCAVYRLTSVAMAKAWLARHGVPPPSPEAVPDRQEEFNL